MIEKYICSNPTRTNSKLKQVRASDSEVEGDEDEDLDLENLNVFIHQHDEEGVDVIVKNQGILRPFNHRDCEFRDFDLNELRSTMDFQSISWDYSSAVLYSNEPITRLREYFEDVIRVLG